MSKLFFLAHPAHFLRGDIARVWADTSRCTECGFGPAGDEESLLMYYWDDEFGDPDGSKRRGHQCFYAGFEIITTEHGKKSLTRFPLAFHQTRLVATQRVRKKRRILDVPQPDEPYYWVRPALFADVAEDNPNELCPTCGKFVSEGRTRQYTRLRVQDGPAVAANVFGVRQNRDMIIFVTETGKSQLEQLNLRIGFYPAGRVV